MKIFNKINYPIFLFTFCVGIFVVYMTSTPKKLIVKYPTPETYKKHTYVDDANNCYHYKPIKETCKGNEKTMPLQLK